MPSAPSWRSLPLLGLLLYPLALVAFDRLVQPVIVPRYLMPLLPAVAAMVAAGSASLRAAHVRVVMAIFAVAGVGELVRIRVALGEPSPRSAAAIVASVERVGPGPIVADWRGYALPIYAARPDLRGRLVFLDDPRQADPTLARSIPYERGMVRIMESFYGWPRTVRPADLRGTSYTLVTEFPERITTGRPTGPLTFQIKPAPAGPDLHASTSD